MPRSALSSIALSALGLVLGFVSVPVMVAGLGYAGYGAYSIAFTAPGTAPSSTSGSAGPG